MVFQRFEYGTARFVGVSAVRETAVLREMENLLEVAGEFLWFHIERAKALDAWSVDEEGRCLPRGDG